ncbi:rootletin-like isoform X3 [Numida meleagris]|uniref:rootletin-like isoform X3 n=1 Tax=Numida meleagris TaxID=8996 RepID=UPI000B3DDB66|nr:rootletin-like isoform X3 [Numida meleagris]
MKTPSVLLLWRLSGWHGPAAQRGFVQGPSVLPRTAQTTPRWAVTGEKPPPGATGHVARHRPLVPSMDPAVPRATLKALGLCTLLVLLVAAVTAAVAVLLWRSEALGKLRGCRERAANESRALELRLAQLERERDRLQRAAQEREREEDALRRELGRAREDGEKLSSSLRSCREQAARLEANVTALRDEVRGLRRERAELSRRNAALQEELAQGAERALGLQQRLEEAAEQRRALRARGERCEERQRELEATLRDRAAELDALRRRLGPRTARRRCPPPRKS